MADNRPLFEYIGDPVCCLNFSSLSSDAINATDTLAGVPILGATGVLFLEILGTSDAIDVKQWQIQYSSTGNASDAVTSNAGMTCTDAIFAVHATYDAGQVAFLDFNVKAKGLDAAAGKLYVSAAAEETGDMLMTIIGIPYGGTRLYPATNAVTAVHADA